MAEALGLKNVQNMDDFQCMDALSEATGTKAPSMLRELENKTPRFTDVIDISQMPSYVQTQANNFAK